MGIPLIFLSLFNISGYIKMFSPSTGEGWGKGE